MIKKYQIFWHNKIHAVEKGEISDNDLKVGLMSLQYVDRKLRDSQGLEQILEYEPKANHWVGKSNINGKSVYFLMSHGLVRYTDLEDKAEQTPNTWVKIHHTHRKKLQSVVKELRDSFISKIVVNPTTNKDDRWVGHTKTGVEHPLDEWWIMENFQTDHPDFFSELYQTITRRKVLLVPDGKRTEKALNPEFEPITYEDEFVYYYFGNGTHCAFANVANLLAYFGDTKGADYFVANITTPLSELLPQKIASCIPVNKRFQRLPIALQCLRYLKYSVTTVKTLGILRSTTPVILIVDVYLSHNSRILTTYMLLQLRMVNS